MNDRKPHPGYHNLLQSHLHDRVTNIAKSLMSLLLLLLPLLHEPPAPCTESPSTVQCKALYGGCLINLSTLLCLYTSQQHRTNAAALLLSCSAQRQIRLTPFRSKEPHVIVHGSNKTDPRNVVRNQDTAHLHTSCAFCTKQRSMHPESTHPCHPCPSNAYDNYTTT